jgi:hypothetical protein
MRSDQRGVSQGFSLWRSAINVAPDAVEGSGGLDSDACCTGVRGMMISLHQGMDKSHRLREFLSQHNSM